MRQGKFSGGNMFNISPPTTKAVGSIFVTYLEPTASVVGVSKKMELLDFLDNFGFEYFA
jgi:hypothetical protein